MTGSGGSYEDQKHYLAFMLKEAQKLFIEEGQRDEAHKVERLFRDVPPGAQRPRGESQFEADVASVLNYIENVSSVPQGTMVQQVEGVLAGVLNKNGIRLTRNFVTALHRVTRNRVFYQTAR